MQKEQAVNMQNVDAESVGLDDAQIMMYTVQHECQSLYIEYVQAWIRSQQLCMITRQIQGQVALCSVVHMC